MLENMMGAGGGNSLDMGSGVSGDTRTDNDQYFGDWGGSMNIAPPKPGFPDWSNPAHLALIGFAVGAAALVLKGRK